MKKRTTCQILIPKRSDVDIQKATEMVLNGRKWSYLKSKW